MAKVLSAGEPILADRPGGIRGLPEPLGSAVVVPVQQGGSVGALLYADSFESSGHAFVPGDLHCLRRFAEVLSC